MANLLRVDEYRVEQREGVRATYDTGHGMRLNADHVTVIFAIGIAANENNVFTVKLQGAREFITNWSGVSDIDNAVSYVRVNRYKQRVQPDGRTIWQYMGYAQGYSARVFPNNVSKIYWAGLGYEADGTTDHNIFTVYMVDGSEFVTDWAGVEAIFNY